MSEAIGGRGWSPSFDFRRGLVVAEMEKSATIRQRTPQREGFMALLRYLVKLRHDETIDDDVFQSLVRKFAAAYIESAVSDAVETRVNVRLAKALTKLPDSYMREILLTLPFK